MPMTLLCKVPNQSQITCINSSEQIYAQRHYNRALIYIQEKKWKIATQELRDAIKLCPNNSEYHALLGVIYLNQNLKGMSRVHIRQALKINSKNNLAVQYAHKVGVIHYIPNIKLPAYLANLSSHLSEKLQFLNRNLWIG